MVEYTPDNDIIVECQGTVECRNCGTTMTDEWTGISNPGFDYVLVEFCCLWGCFSWTFSTIHEPDTRKAV